VVGRIAEIRAETGPPGTNVADRDVLGDWNWHFRRRGAAFFGNGFTCSVRRIRNN